MPQAQTGLWNLPHQIPEWTPESTIPRHFGKPRVPLVINL